MYNDYTRRHPRATARYGSSQKSHESQKPQATGPVLSREEALALEYPWRRMFKTEDDLQRAFTAVRAARLNIVPTRYRIINMPQLSPAALQYRGRQVLIALDPADYETMNWMSDWFNERARLQCKRYDEPLSPMEYWVRYKDGIVDSIPPERLTPRALSDAVYEKVMGCNNFRPGLMRAMIAHFRGANRASNPAPYRVLDFSAGWGDRLIGALAAGADATDTRTGGADLDPTASLLAALGDDRVGGSASSGGADSTSASSDSAPVHYTGVDPNPETQEGYREIIRTFGGESDIIQAPFQRADLSHIPDGTIDLVLTSPPYFALESYGEDEGQSIVEFPELDGWFSGFLMTSLRRCWEKLAVGGHMVIVINNIRDSEDFVLRMIAGVNDAPDAEYLGVLPYAEQREDRRNGRGGARNGAQTYYKSPQPMWIWRKSPVRIERLAETHVDGLARISGDPVVMKSVANGRTWSAEHIRGLIQYDEQDRQSGAALSYYHYAIVESDDVVGYVGLYPLDKHAPGELQTRIFLGRDAQGKGYSRPAMQLMIREYFRAGPTQVYMQVAPDNAPSLKLAQSLGFVEQPGSYSMSGVKLLRFRLNAADCLGK